MELIVPQSVTFSKNYRWVFLEFWLDNFQNIVACWCKFYSILLLSRKFREAQLHLGVQNFYDWHFQANFRFFELPSSTYNYNFRLHHDWVLNKTQVVEWDSWPEALDKDNSHGKFTVWTKNRRRTCTLRNFCWCKNLFANHDSYSSSISYSGC